MRVIVTNDDGVEAEGIHVLAGAFVDAGHEVVVVAPAHDHSGTGASLGKIVLSEHIGAVPAEVDALAGIEAWAIDGPPGLCVLAARMGAFGAAPDVVVSGINDGLNTGRAVLHSGTVGAALTAQNFGIPALAVSTEMHEPWFWETAAALAVDVLPLLGALEDRRVLNLNVPSRPIDEVLGIRWARLAPFGEVQSTSAEVDGARLRFTFQARDRGADDARDLTTDQHLVGAGYASLTPLAGLAEGWGPAAIGLVAAGGPMHGAVPGEAVAIPGRDPDAGTGASLPAAG